MNEPVGHATVSGVFSDGSSVWGCTTGASGTCSMEPGYQWGDRLTFTVTNVSATLPYSPSENRDPDGDSNGTSITVYRP
jgi:hypothetical protein